MIFSFHLQIAAKPTKSVVTVDRSERGLKKEEAADFAHLEVGL